MALSSCPVEVPPVWRGLAPGLLLAGAVALWPTCAAAAAAPLVGGGSGLCLDVKAVDMTPGASVQVYTCNGGANQQWTLTAAGELRTLGGARCLDAKNAATTPGTPLISYTCNGQANQRWTIVGKTIRGAGSGLCMDVAHAATQPGSLVQLWTCNGGSNQVWNGLPASTDTQAPTPPSGLKLADLACRSATLSWTASTDNVGVAFYDVYHDGQLITVRRRQRRSPRASPSSPASPGASTSTRATPRATSRRPAPRCAHAAAVQVDTRPPTVPTGLAGTARAPP